MKHPSEYTTVPFHGFKVMQVDPGTDIKDERSGETITVDDESSAVKGNIIFCTEKTFNALKAKTKTL